MERGIGRVVNFNQKSKDECSICIIYTYFFFEVRRKVAAVPPEGFSFLSSFKSEVIY